MPVMSEAVLQLKSLSRFPFFALCFKGEMLSYYREAIFNSAPQKNKMESLISDTVQHQSHKVGSRSDLYESSHVAEVMLCHRQQNRRNVAQ